MALETTLVPKDHLAIVEGLLRSLKESQQQEKGSMTFLVGPKGIGQDRLVEAALHRDANKELNVHRIPLSEADARRPFYPVTTLIRRAAERSRALSPAYSLFLTPFLSTPGTVPTRSGGRTLPRSHLHKFRPPASMVPEAPRSSEASHQRLLADLEFYKRGVEAWGDRSRFIHEVGEAIVSLAREEPTLWLLEGAQNLDPHSWSVVRYLSERLSDTPLVIWATIDLDEQGGLPSPVGPMLAAKGVQRVDVPALSREGVESLLSRWVPKNALSSQFVDIVERVSQGRPVFIEEIARGQGSFPGGRTLSFRVGEQGAEELALERTERLPESTRALLQRLSFLGRHFSLYLASQVVEMPPASLEKGLGELVKEGFLQVHPGSLYSFSVPALADELRESVPKEQRQHLHLRVAEALELTSSSLREETLLLADHWWEAGEWEKASESNLRAAQFALRAYAPDAALRYVERARDAATRVEKGRGSSLAPVLVEEGQALYDLGRLKESKKALEGALKLVGKSDTDWPLRARALFLLARTLGSLSRGDETFPLVEEAKEALSQVKDVRGQLMLHQVVGVSLMMTGQNEDAATHFRAMMKLAQELDDARELSYAQKNLSAVLLSKDPHNEEGMSLVASALEFHTRTENYAGLAAGYLNRGLTYLDLKEPAKALVDLDRSRQAAEKAHAPLLVSSAVLTEATILLDEGEASQAYRVLRKLEPWVGTMEAPADRAGYLILLGRVMEAEERTVEAHRTYVRALREAEVAPGSSELWESHLRLALMARKEGNVPEAEEHRKALPPAAQLEKSFPSLQALVKEYETLRGK